MTASAFGEMIRDRRCERNISQRALAELTGVDFTYLSKIENGRLPPPSEEVINRLAFELHLNSDELMRLAGKVPSDLIGFLVNDTHALHDLRQLQRCSVVGEERE